MTSENAMTGFDPEVTELVARLRDVGALFGERANHTMHRFKSERMEAARMIERLAQRPSAPQGTYLLQDQTMQRVFRAAGLDNLSDLQAVFNATEVALTNMHQEAQAMVAAAYEAAAVRATRGAPTVEEQERIKRCIGELATKEATDALKALQREAYEAGRKAAK